MSGTFLDIAKLYPLSDEYWNIRRPGRVLRGALRQALLRQWGFPSSSQDFAKIMGPMRLGISTRPYQPGDSLHAVSHSQTLKTGEVYIQCDYHEGTSMVGVFWLKNKNFSFKSKYGKTSKGQLALSVAGILDVLCESFGRTLDFHMIDDFSLISKKYKYVFIITDGLFDKDELKIFFEKINLCSCLNKSIIWIRDIAEVHFANNPLKNESFQLQGDINSPLMLFSGQEYIKNLFYQYQNIEELCEQSLCSSYWALENNLLNNFLLFLASFSFLKDENRRGG